MKCMWYDTRLLAKLFFCVFKDRDDVEVDNLKENFSCGTNAGNPEWAGKMVRAQEFSHYNKLG